MVRLSSHELVTSAMVGGICEHYAHLRRCTRDEALARIRACLLEEHIPADRQLLVLTNAAARYTHPSRPFDGECLSVLVDLGVNADAAAELYRVRHSKGSGAWRV
jgi:hypothetical protein